MKSSEITSRAKSNLAFALNVMPKERRDDMVIFYAFCRVIDDLADDQTRSLEDKKIALEKWRVGIQKGFFEPNEFQKEFVTMQQKYKIPSTLLVEIIDGCMMDILPMRFQTWTDLKVYTWKVACVVGLTSLPLFGAKHPQSKEYAINLGHALQLTNIIRDVGDDLKNGNRIYLPLDDLKRFSYSEHDLINRVYDDRFLAVINYQADRAEKLFTAAQESLPNEDKKSLLAAEVMLEIYHTLLKQMRNDKFRILEKRYSLSKLRKISILAKHMIS
jgi:15-cis-phytoene synthase